MPTFLYDYPQAVKDSFLVDFSLYQAHTSSSAKGVDLSEEDRNALTEQGIDPDSLDYAGGDRRRVIVPNHRTHWHIAALPRA